MNGALSRRAVLATLAAGSAACSRGAARRRAIERAAAWLWSCQASDGGWHSETYGLLRSGQSLTPFVLDGLLAAGAPRDGRVDRALSFIERQVSAEGGVGLAEPGVTDYPTYATALTILVLRRVGRTAQLPRLGAWLRSRQFSAENGWPPSHAAHGGWGMGATRPVPPDTGHLDLSMTRHALQAMAVPGDAQAAASLAAARAFLGRCQNPDGGFFFSPVILDANKAGWERDHPRSYGTATADGVLALVATGCRPETPAVSRARQWLVKHDHPGRVAGFPEARALWSDGLRYYHAATSAEARRVLREPGRPAAERQLLAEQQEDGSWRNRSTMVKEDDPLIATGLALRALTAMELRAT